jgi:iron complex transport system permease protein
VEWRAAVAIAGAGGAACLVFAIAAKRDFAPVALILAGLMVSLYCGALATILVLLNDKYLVSLFIWGSGSLSQQGWGIVRALWPEMLACMLAMAVLSRPLAVLQIGDDNARARGVSPAMIRKLCIAVAIILSAMVTSHVGVIGFIGLLAPTLARLSGARTPQQHLLWSTLLGAVLLWATDGIVQLVSGSLSEFVPTGAVTALFGSPLLLLLIPRLKMARPVMRQAFGVAVQSNKAVWVTALALAAIAALCCGLALCVGRGVDGGLVVLGVQDWRHIYEWRFPRVVGALAGGVMLAIAGTILQRLCHNDMASPEVLGVNAGAMIGLGIGLFTLPVVTSGALLACACLGAVGLLVVLFAYGRKAGFQPERMVLVGIALGAMLDAFVGAIAAAGDVRSLQLLRWMAGSTYGITHTMAWMAILCAGTLAILALLAARMMNVLQLGVVVAQGLGLRVKAARIILFALAGGLTAVATILVGPLSFVGLMAPHMAKSFGCVRAFPQIIVAALAGGSLMISADWIGRISHFPYELPAGILSALVGAPVLFFILRRQGG